jgi:hypothetical protein
MDEHQAARTECSIKNFFDGIAASERSRGLPFDWPDIQFLILPCFFDLRRPDGFFMA